MHKSFLHPAIFCIRIQNQIDSFLANIISLFQISFLLHRFLQIQLPPNWKLSIHYLVHQMMFKISNGVSSCLNSGFLLEGCMVPSFKYDCFYHSNHLCKMKLFNFYLLLIHIPKFINFILPHSSQCLINNMTTPICY